MIIQEKPVFMFDQRYFPLLLKIIFALGLFSLVALVVSAFVACLYIMNLAITVLAELVTTISTLYAHSDAAGKLVMLLALVLLLYKLIPLCAKPARRFLHIS